MEIDWLECELVESVEGRCGGQPTVVGTRIFPHAILSCFENGDSVQVIHEEAYPSLSIAQIEGLLRFAREQRLREAA